MTATALPEAPVLVVGAGPVGLTLACELRRHGVACRIIDRNDGPTPLNESRALGIQARTMEVFRETGIADAVLARAKQFHGMSAFSAGRRVAHLSFDFEDLDTRYPHVFGLPQSITERLLIDRLAALGGAVERETSLTSFAQDGAGVTATLADSEGRTSEVRAGWIVGCDGSRSVVRETLDLRFEGGEYEELFLIADARVDWGMPVAEDEIAFFLTPEGPIVSFPFPEPGRWRLVDTTGLVEAKDQEGIVARFRDLITQHVSPGATITDPTWTSSFHIHRRVVDTYRVRRAFVAGDAAHLHSPAGGQGMNTGIQDASNLAWKLALVIGGKARDALLDSYSPERRSAVAGVLTGSDLATRAVTLRNELAKGVRDALMGVLGEFDLVRRKISRAISELAVAYRDSPIVAEDHQGLLHALIHRRDEPGVRDVLDFASAPRPGDRAPDVPLESGGPLRWLADFKHPTLHTLFLFPGAAGRGGDDRLAAMIDLVRGRYADLIHPALVARADTPATPPVEMVPDPKGEVHGRFGAHAACLYLIRPDGYIGYRALPPDPDALRAYLDRLFIRDGTS
ncbi:MAG: FAD-dependent monooxygenase [Planctomycetaceae bacterium]|nr:FAD-dependent monooxygenase [Planctomycetaceae bacterium]